jgi:tetratricopeptide (TPR) repeat protein
VTSLRAALRVYQPDTHPVAWASTQLNLANALQYLPSVHQESNLDEAVQLYEELLQHRDPHSDPLGYARILANQGNALGHLGVFVDARTRLTQARDLFEKQGDPEAAASVDEVLASLTSAETTATAAGA